MSFASTINAINNAASDRALTITAGTGIVTFGGNIGAGANGALADLDVSAATINVNAGRSTSTTTMRRPRR